MRRRLLPSMTSNRCTNRFATNRLCRVPTNCRSRNWCFRLYNVLRVCRILCRRAARRGLRRCRGHIPFRQLCTPCWWDHPKVRKTGDRLRPRLLPSHHRKHLRPSGIPIQGRRFRDRHSIERRGRLRFHLRLPRIRCL